MEEFLKLKWITTQVRKTKTLEEMETGANHLPNVNLVWSSFHSNKLKLRN